MNCAVLVLSFFPFFLSGQTAQEPYVWPLELPRELTSSFGEYRPGRFHMGIDLRTGPVGKNVYAADDGYVARISCSPHGYGKAIYLQLNDGNLAVYAHLDEFMPPFAEYVRQAQHQAKSYTVNLSPSREELPVKRGQLIARSGQTGIGVPHLHYEIRDRNDPASVLNPGALGVTWPDDTAPVFRKVAVIPLEPDSTVNGDVFPVVRDVRPGAGGGYTVGELRASGPFAVAVDVIDPAPGGSRLGVYRLTTRLNGRETFRIVHDRISYRNDDDGVAAYEPALRDKGQFLLQWRKPNNESEIYPQDGADGRIELQESADEVTVLAEDFRGNSTVLTIPVRREAPAPHAPPNSGTADRVDTGRGEAVYDYTGVLFVATARFDADETVTPVLRVSGAIPDALPMRRVGPREFRLAYRPAETYLESEVRIEHPRIDTPSEKVAFWQRTEKPSPREIDFGFIRVTGFGNPYAMLPIRARRVEIASPHPELTPVSEFVELWPPNAAYDANSDPGYLRIGLPLTAGTAPSARLLTYRQTRDGWETLDRLESRGIPSAATTQFGVFAVMEDTVAPQIRVLAPAAGTRPASRRPELKAEILDRGSGIDTYEATCNGQWLLMEYDPEQDLLVWERDEDLPGGPVRIEFDVTDRAGNRTQRVVELQVPQ